jgi:uncharacterized repeat protein (TIGR01451 family)
MNKPIFNRNLVISLFIIGFAVSLLSFSMAAAQNQAAPTPTILGTVELVTETPTPTIELPNVELIKEYKIISDLNNVGIIDPGDKIMYTITYSNKGPTDAANLVIQDKLPVQYFETIKKEEISKGGTYNGQIIEWKVDTLPAGSSDSVSFSATLNSQLASGVTEISNPVAIFKDGIEVVEAKSVFSVNVLTPTVSPSSTPVPTLAQTPGAATATAVSPGASALSGSFGVTVIIGLLALIGIFVFTAIGGYAKYTTGQNDEEHLEAYLTRINVFREGVIIVFIVSAVLLMGISNTLPSDGVISILSAIVGYVFGRSTAAKR